MLGISSEEIKMTDTKKTGTYPVFLMFSHLRLVTFRFGKQGQQFFGRIPTDAGIRNTLTVNFRLVLAAFNQVAFHHHAHDVFFTGFQLCRNIARHIHLFAEVFTAVGMAAVHHQFAAHAGFLKLRNRVFNVFRAVIRLFTATQNRMAVRVAAGVDNRGMTGFGYRQEVVRMIGGADGVDGDFQVAVRTVLKPTGQERPLANSRCTWLSVVRAPIAPQEIRSA